VSHEMEMEDYYLDTRRKLAVSEEQNELLREQNSRLTLALDEALALARQYRKDAHPGMDKGGYEL
jgi:hypothetical protein